MKLVKKTNLSYHRLRSLLNYDPETGLFTWIGRTTNRVHVGDIAGSNSGKGYLEIGIDEVNYLAHRLAWFWVTASWPPEQVDHRDLNGKNNKWTNLRLATHGQNVHNSGPRKHNSHGIKGITFVERLQKWHARIMFDRQLYLLGYFRTPEEAQAAYAQKAAELHGEFARTEAPQ